MEAEVLREPLLCQAVLQDRLSSERMVSQGQHGGNHTWDKGQRGNESLIGASTGLLVSVNKQLAWLEPMGQLHILDHHSCCSLLSFYYFTCSDHKYKQAVGERKQAYQFIHVIFFFLSFQVIRLESQVSRYKQAAENAEKIEDELKAEKRKLQREVNFLGYF